VSERYIRTKGVFDPILDLSTIEGGTVYHMQPEETLAALTQHATLRAMAMFPLNTDKYGVKVTGIEIKEDGKCSVHLHLVRKENQ